MTDSSEDGMKLKGTSKAHARAAAPVSLARAL
jgi:hypothetical protein